MGGIASGRSSGVIHRNFRANPAFLRAGLLFMIYFILFLSYILIYFNYIKAGIAALRAGISNIIKQHGINFWRTAPFGMWNRLMSVSATFRRTAVFGWREGRKVIWISRFLTASRVRWAFLFLYRITEETAQQFNIRPGFAQTRSADLICGLIMEK